jgi:hypothetical protein
MMLSGPFATSVEIRSGSMPINGTSLIAIGLSILVALRTATTDAQSTHNIIHSISMDRLTIKDLIPITWPCLDP